MAHQAGQALPVDLIDPRTVQEVAAIYAARRARGWSDFAAHHAAVMVLWETWPNQSFRALAEAVAAIVAPIEPQRQAA